MKKKNILKALAALTLGSAAAFGLTLTGCKKDEPTPGDTHDHTYSNLWSYDDTHHWHEATCDDLHEGDADYKIDYGAHVDGDDDGLCDECDYVMSEPEGKHYVSFELDGHGTEIEPILVVEGETVTRPTDPTAEGYTFGGWYTDQNFTNLYNFDTPVTGHITLYAKWTANSAVEPEDPDHEHTFETRYTYDLTHHWFAASCEHGDEISGKEEHHFVNGKCECGATDPNLTTPDSDDGTHPDEAGRYDDVTSTPAQVADPNVVEYKGPGAALEAGSKTSVYELDADEFTATTYANGWTDGIFTISAGTEVRGRARSDADQGGNSIFGEGIPKDFVSVNSIKMGNATSTIKVAVAGSGTLKFYVENGSSGVDTQSVNIAGPNGTVTKTYPGNGLYCIEIAVTEGEYTVSRVSGTIDIYWMELTTTVETAAITGINIANSGTVDYLVGQQLDCTGIVVTATHANGIVSPVSNANLQIDTSAYDPTRAGTYAIKVTYNLEGNIDGATTFETTYNVNVYDYTDLKISYGKTVQGANSAAGNGVYEYQAVRQYYFVGEEFSTKGLTLIGIGTLNNKTKEFTLDFDSVDFSGFDSNTAGVKTVKVSYTLNGLTKAIGFTVLVNNEPADLATAETVVCAVNAEFSEANVGTLNSSGAYRFCTIQQALEFIENSNVQDGAQKIIYLAEGTYWEKLEVRIPNLTIIGAGADDTLLEFDTLFGVVDAGGFTQTTDSTATLNVRDTAVNFTIKGVTISNYYHSEDSYKNAPSSDQRALAMLVQADKVTIDSCALLGYQDTVEFMTGRQLVVNTLIIGRTDFIFGSNNTTYFYNCEIRSIGKSGGYVTAFKGNNKGEQDAITYGAIFDNCHFTGEATATSTALGRPWGAYAAVAVINSTIDGHVSKTAYDGKVASRYVAMSSVTPLTATVKFVEYNNTGAGAITSAVAGMTMLTAEQAANYSDASVIFGRQNGNLTYADVWDIQLPGEEHTHTYGNWVVAEVPTATATGYASKTCTDTDCEVNDDRIIFKVLPEITYANLKYYTYEGTAEDEIWTYTLKSDTSITFQAAKIADMHFHNFTDWVVDTEPTATTTGLATRTCSGVGDCDELLEYTLPKLTDSKYTITDNTAEIGKAGRGTYTITIGDKQLSFEADTPAKAAETTYDKLVYESENLLFNEDFSKGYEKDGTLSKFNGVYGTAGVYSKSEGSGVLVTNGSGSDLAVQHAVSSSNVGIIIDIGLVKGVVEGCFDITADAMGTKWAIVQFIGSTNDGEINGSEVFAIYTNDDTSLFDYRLYGTKYSVGLSSAANTLYTIYYKLDLDTGLLTVKINNDYLVQNLETKINGLNGFELNSSSSGTRHVKIDNIAVVGTAMTVSDYQTLLDAKLEATYKGYDLESDYSTNGAQVTSAYEAGLAAVKAATTIEGVHEAYLACLANMSAVKSDLRLAKDDAIADINDQVAALNESDYTDANWATLLGYKTEGLANIEAAKTVEEVTTTLQKVQANISSVPNSALQAELNARDELKTMATVPAAPKEINFYNIRDGKAYSIETNQAFGSSFLKLTTVGKAAWKSSESGINLRNATITITTTSANAQLKINYYNTTSGRIFTVAKGGNTLFTEEPATWSSAAGGGLGGNDKTNTITLAEIGTYTITFGDEGDHKVSFIALYETELAEVTAKVNSLSATVSETASVGDTIDSLISDVKVQLDYNGDMYEQTITAYTVIVKNSEDESVTELSEAGEYTVTIINGADKTAGTEYNSHSYTVTVS